MKETCKVCDEAIDKSLIKKVRDIWFKYLGFFVVAIILAVASIMIYLIMIWSYNHNKIHSHTKIVAPNGAVAYKIECYSDEACWIECNTVCKHGYTLISSNMVSSNMIICNE